jgi:four helix bundle protein
MKILNFEQIESWQKSRELVKSIYKLFSGNKDFNFTSQILRACLSIPTNIAEGFDRGTNKEFVQYLIIARGSVSEVKSLVYIAGDLNYIDDNESKILLDKCDELSKIINGFIRYLKQCNRKS